MRSKQTLHLREVRIGASGPIGDVRIVDGVVREVAPWLPRRSEDENVTEAGGTLLPGLWDAHVHVTQWACTRRRLDLSHAASAREAIDELVRHVCATPVHAGEVVTAYGLRDGHWRDTLHSSQLERALPGQSAVLISHDLHTVWASPAAFHLLALPSASNGALHEADALAAITSLTEADTSTSDAIVLDACAAAAARGVVGIIDFEAADNIAHWQRRSEGRRLPVRVDATIYPEHLDEAIDAGLRDGQVMDAEGRVRVGPVKFFVDGSLNAHTALCYDPYQGGADRGHGMLTWPPEALVPAMREVVNAGLRPALHAIGDHANTIALNAFETVGCTGRIEHAQLLLEEDLARFATLGVVAGIQPAHLTEDRDVADRIWAGRTSRAFPHGSLLRAGASIEIGSDAPVSPLDPWQGIAAAVTRTSDQRAAWHAEQAMSVSDALAASARGRRAIDVGSVADLVLVREDVATTPASQLADVEVVGTLVGGGWTYQR